MFPMFYFSSLNLKENILKSQIKMMNYYVCQQYNICDILIVWRYVTLTYFYQQR